MAKFIFQINFLLILLITISWLTLVISTEPGDFNDDYGTMLAEEQQVYGASFVRPGESVICNFKKDLIHNLEQLSFYLKADCQKENQSAVGCSCWPPKCASRCTPTRVCCAQNTTALLVELEGFNAFYANHFKDLFGGAPEKGGEKEGKSPRLDL
ncbi:hypothetical protein H2200_007656 [Cladophialophora chaetospira]|uniref:Hydrophobin n=1 Tax=Cladophialophora chaetospira TaxID=386627 RepID=A0AA38X6B0_9EURO|nr:hypothetical protein H2200_007656 [Cladophialophora chaetospira]